MDKSLAKTFLWEQVLKLNNLIDHYCHFPQNEKIGDYDYTYAQHIEYLEEKIQSYTWAIEVLKKAEAETP